MKIPTQAQWLLSTHARNVLRMATGMEMREDFSTDSELARRVCEIGAVELNRLPKCGRTTLNEIAEWITSLGIPLDDYWAGAPVVAWREGLANVQREDNARRIEKNLEIMRLRLVEKLTYRKIAERYDISTERVRRRFLLGCSALGQPAYVDHPLHAAARGALAPILDPTGQNQLTPDGMKGS
jgi:hypothetical protein